MNPTPPPTAINTPLSPPHINNGDTSGGGGALSSLTIGIIVLCVLCGLVLAALGAFIIMNRQRLFRQSAKKRTTAITTTGGGTMDNGYERKTNLDETPAWRFWPFSVSSVGNIRQHSATNTLPDRYTQLVSSLPTAMISNKKKKASVPMTRRTMLDDIPLPPAHLTPLTPSISITKTPLYQQGKDDEQLFEEGYDPKALRSPYRQRHQQQHNQFTASVCTLTNTTSGASVTSSVNDPSLLESLERQKQINGMYYKTSSASAQPASYRHHRQSSSWGSSTIIQQPCIAKHNNNNNSSLLSLSMIEKQEQEAELQRLSISSYHVW